MGRLISALLTLMIIALVTGAVGFKLLLGALAAPGPLQQETIIRIERGNGLNSIATKLEDQQAVPSRWLFILAAKLKDSAGGLKAGEYVLTPGISVYDILAKMENGDVYRRQITIPEGLRTSEIITLLKAEPALSGEITDIPPEGSLLPDSYAYLYQDSRASILQRMQQAMEVTLASAWEQRAPDLPYADPAQALVMASIIEKETGIAGERAKISGVFTNRLRINMPLQTDPTVIYAIYLSSGPMTRPLNRKDIRETESPYNTYLNAGLPPGPITNPGRAAIEAALNPDTHDYLYFVADGTGGHAFGKTLTEHNRNVANWRRHSSGLRGAGQ